MYRYEVTVTEAVVLHGVIPHGHYVYTALIYVPYTVVGYGEVLRVSCDNSVVPRIVGYFTVIYKDFLTMLQIYDIQCTVVC